MVRAIGYGKAGVGRDAFGVQKIYAHFLYLFQQKTSRSSLSRERLASSLKKNTHKMPEHLSAAVSLSPEACVLWSTTLLSSNAKAENIALENSSHLPWSV